jgi:hypothetical protein
MKVQSGKMFQGKGLGINGAKTKETLTLDLLMRVLL